MTVPAASCFTAVPTLADDACSEPVARSMRKIPPSVDQPSGTSSVNAFSRGSAWRWKTILPGLAVMAQFLSC
jgi:hypothetical protein